MRKFLKFLVPLVLGAAIAASIVWYLFVYDRDFTRDSLLSQARYQDMYGNSRLSAWFYDAAYSFSGHDQNVAIELANQYKLDGNYTKAEATLTKAIRNAPTPELYTALCKAFVEQDKLMDAVWLLENIGDSAIKETLEARRPEAPVPDAAPGYYSEYMDLHMSSEGSKYIFFSTDGEFPSISDGHYNGSIPLDAGLTQLRAIAVSESGLVSPIAAMEYTITGIIEEVTFHDPIMEKAIREAIHAGETRKLYTNELWQITEFTTPDGVTTYADLSALPELTKLTISNQKIDSLSHLSGLTKLAALDLTGSRFPTEEMAVLAALPSLSSLNMTDCGLSTIDALEGADSITHLDLSHNSLRKLDVLSGMTNLTELNLSDNAVTNLDALSGLEQLSMLTVNHNLVSSLSPLSSCIRLKHLEADHNKLTNLKGIPNLTLLEHLSVDYNELTDAALLTGNTELKNLSIASNAIDDIMALHTLHKLEVFDFSGNLEITSLPNWPEGMPLKTIDGSYNSLENIDALKSMDSLTHIYMDYNKLTNIDALADCYCLVQINVYGNSIPDVKLLREKDIIVNYDPTVKTTEETEG